MDVGFGEELDFVADELDAFPVAAVDYHHVALHFRGVVAVDLGQELFDQRQLAGPGRAVEQNVGDLVAEYEPVQFSRDLGVDVEHSDWIGFYEVYVCMK